MRSIKIGEEPLKTDLYERLVIDFFHNRGFQCARFSKEEMATGPTPDFRVYKNIEFRFFCEVKSIRKCDWLESMLEVVPPGTIVEREQDDPTFNHIVKDIHQAVRQFDAVNPKLTYPNVLALVNNDPMIMSGDVREVFLSKRYSGGRIKEEKTRIHLFLWIDALKNTNELLFTSRHNIQCDNLRNWLKDTKYQ
jgi:hypothetical protein